MAEAAPALASSSQGSPLLVFVGGPPRSGTTLLQNMLDSHPDVIGLPEFIATREVVQLKRRLRDLVQREWIDLICTSDDVDAAIADLLRRLLTARVPGDGVRVISEKTPENCLVFGDLAELMPEAKFVGVVRDPRGTVSSLLRVGLRARGKLKRPPLRTLSTFEAIAYTAECMRATLRAAGELGDRFHLVDYGDLVTEPEEAMRRLCRFLGLDFSPSMVQPADDTHVGEKAITVQSREIWYTPDEFNRDPDPGRLGRWRETLSDREQAVISLATARLLGDVAGSPHGLSIDGYGRGVRAAAGVVAGMVVAYDHHVRGSLLLALFRRLIELRTRIAGRSRRGAP